MNAPPEIYEFDEFQLDAVKRLLTKRGGETVSLAPKAFETLLYLVRHPGELLTKDEMMQAVWADTIVEENNLNQSISALRRVLGERRDEHRFIVTVPGRGYKFVAEVRKADVNFLQGNGATSEMPGRTGNLLLERPSESSNGSDNSAKVEISDSRFEPYHEQMRTRPSALQDRKWLFALASLCIVAMGATGFYLWRDRSKTVAGDSPIKTLAVLPFKPLVAETRNDALELGMADTLISKLSGGEELIVSPLDSVRRSISSKQDSLIIGRNLDVEAILDGSIQAVGTRIRISARLLRTSDGKQLWAGQFEENYTDIFAVQDSIAERVAAALQTRLGGGVQKRDPANVEAYQLYVKGRFHAARLIQPETAKAISYFSEAIEIDPNYALAYVALAQAYRRLSLASDVPASETFPKAKAAALKAVEIDETLAEAHIALGITAFWYEWDWQAAENQYLRALELDPNDANALGSYAHLLSNTGRHEMALAEAKRSREDDPLRLGANALEGQYLLFAGKPDEALDRLKETIDLDPNFWLAHLILSRVYAEKGMHAEAAAATKARELSNVNSESIALIGYSLAKSGEIERARTVLDELLKLSTERYVPPYNLAVAYNGLGQSEKTLDYLEKGFAERDVRMVFLKVEPKWNNLRSHPRFVELIKRMNFQ